MNYNLLQVISSLERKLSDRYPISNSRLIKSIKWVILAVLILLIFLICIPLFTQIKSIYTLRHLAIVFFGLFMLGVFFSICFYVHWRKMVSSKNHLKNLIRTFPGAVYRCLMDKNWTMIFISDEIEQLSGYPPSDFLKNLKRSYTSIIHPEDVEHVDRVIQNAINEKKSFTIEYRIINSNNEEVWVYERGQAEYNSRGNVTYLNGAILNISRRKLIEAKLIAERTGLQRILDSSPIIVIIKTDSVISYANHQAKAILGYREGDFIKDSYLDQSDREYIMDEIEMGNPVINYSLRLYDSKRKILDCTINYYPIEFDGKKSMLGWYIID